MKKLNLESESEYDDEDLLDEEEEETNSQARGKKPGQPSKVPRALIHMPFDPTRHANNDRVSR